MRIDMSKFGTFLISRPAGREAILAARAYTIPKDTIENIELDFSKVSVITPSWIDEFLRGLEETYGKEKIIIVPTENPSVRLAIEAVQK
jgi:hypothetical protein